jgi:hypothetical protein
MRPDQIKQLASAFANLGVGMILAGIVGPVITGTVGDMLHIAFWLMSGATAIAASHELLGRLP